MTPTSMIDYLRAVQSGQRVWMRRQPAANRAYAERYVEWIEHLKPDGSLLKLEMALTERGRKVLESADKFEAA